MWHGNKLIMFVWTQGNTDHASGLQTKLGCNSVGQFPLYQAAMSLMEEVMKHLPTHCTALLLVVISDHWLLIVAL